MSRTTTCRGRGGVRGRSVVPFAGRDGKRARTIGGTARAPCALRGVAYTTRSSSFLSRDAFHPCHPRGLRALPDDGPSANGDAGVLCAPPRGFIGQITRTTNIPTFPPPCTLSPVSPRASGIPVSLCRNNSPFPLSLHLLLPSPPLTLFRDRT